MFAKKNIVLNHKSMTFNCDSRILFLLLGLFFFLNGSKSIAAEVINNLNFDFYSQENGLSNIQIHCIRQDKKGWMWFNQSSNQEIWDIFQDDDETLWIGTYANGLLTVNPNALELKQLTLDSVNDRNIGLEITLLVAILSFLTIVSL